MKIIPPIEVTDANLTSSNVPETDAPFWLIGTTYAINDQVIYEHNIYESLVGGNAGNQPDISPTEWLFIGATNRYKAFDKRLSDVVSQAESITYTINHNGEFVSAVAFFGLKGSTLLVEVNDPDDGLAFSQSYVLLDDTGVIDWSTYFFSPIGVQRQEVLEVALPPYLNASTTVTITNAGGIAQVGQIVLGRLFDLGVTVYGTSISIEDYSRKERDAFGNAIIVERAFAQLVDYDVRIRTEVARRTQNTFAQYRTTPIVWVGDEKEELGTIVYGYYRRFDITLSSPLISDATIEVEGLI